MSEGICDSESLETVEYVLHTRDHDTNAYKVLIAAKYADIYVKHVKYSEDPVLKMPDGAISESNAIARYVARLEKTDSLYNSSQREEIEKWIDFSTFEICANIRRRWLSSCGFYIRLDVEYFLGSLESSLWVLNEHLDSKSFLVGQSETLADIIITCDLLFGINKGMTNSFMCEFCHINSYFREMINLPNFRKVLGDSVLEKRFRFSRPWKPKASAKQKARIDTLKSADSLHNWKVLYRNTRKIEFECL